MSREGSQSAIVWPYVIKWNLEEKDRTHGTVLTPKRDRRNVPVQRHALSVGTRALDDAIANGKHWRKIREMGNLPTGVTLGQLLQAHTLDRDDPILRRPDLNREISFGELTFDETFAAACGHDLIEDSWAAQVKEWEAVNRGEAYTVAPNRDHYRLEYLRHFSRLGLSAPAIFVIHGMTHLKRPTLASARHPESKYWSVREQGERLLAHPVVSLFKGYDVEDNVSEPRSYPYQGAINTIQAVWKSNEFHKIAGVVLPSRRAWAFGHLPMDVQKLPFVREIMDGTYEKVYGHLDPSSNPDVIREVTPERFPVQPLNPIRIERLAKSRQLRDKPDPAPTSDRALDLPPAA